MKRSLLVAPLFAVVTAWLLTGAIVFAQQRWGAPAAPAVAGPVLEWRDLAGDPDRLYLYSNGVQIGGYCNREKHYRPYNVATRAWGEPATCPVAPPAFARAPEPIAAPQPFVAGDDPNNFGIDLDKVHDAKPGHRYHLNGKEVNRAQAFDAVGDALPDDADAMRLTWIGAADVGAKIRGDVDAAAPLANWKGKVSLQSYPSADEPILKGLGFAPGLAVQAAAGKPLWYAGDYKGADDLAGGLLLADARRKDPAWDPMKWPALNAPPKAPDPVVPAPAPAPSIDLAAWLKQNWAIVAAAIAGFFLFRQKAKVQA